MSSILNNLSNSKKLFEQAQKVLVGGVNSPVRAFKGVGGSPIVMQSGSGAYLTDVDNNTYIDYVGSFGPSILGHAHPEVVQEINETSKNALTFGTPCELETKLAKCIVEDFKSMDKIRFVSSGTEACMSALRLARGYTKKTKIIKFIGCYHGHADMLLTKAGSGVMTLGLPDSPGVPAETTKHTLLATMNDKSSVENIFAQYKDDIAAIIIEPIAGNTGFIRQDINFLKFLKEITKINNSLLIFDEVMTGYRVAIGGAQVLYDIEPDITVLGKVIGGGLPVGAYGARDEIMQELAPLGSVYQAGTLSGSPLAMASGLKTLEVLKKDNNFDLISKTTKKLLTSLQEVATKHNVKFQADFEGGMFGFFFNENKINNQQEASKSDTVYFKKFFWEMIDQGIYFAPSAFEAGFVSLAHSEKDVKKTIIAAEKVFNKLK